MYDSLLEDYRNAVTDYLRSTLQSDQVTSIQLNHDYPAVLVTVGNVVGCFCFAGSNYADDYKRSYGAFKHYYASKENEWQSSDIAFVLCVSMPSATIDDFRSRIETDVFFCRKFVIPLTRPIEECLSRLPFLPLAQLSDVSLRPVSAQTYLQDVGVPAALARHLVIQGERSADSIFKDCLEEAHGAPLTLSAHGKPRAKSIKQSPATSIELLSLSIEHFRAYKSRRDFALGSDITVLYGPNGFGKTSFFDAIDFAATGSIGRLGPRSDQQFERAATNLDSSPSQGEVQLTFKSPDGSHHRISRAVRSRRKALLDDQQIDRKSALTALTGGRLSGSDRIENMVALFRATHLFSQEQQELTRDFQDDCRLSGEIVSRLLAFEDYANAINKSGEVRSLIKSAISSGERKQLEIEARLKEDEAELSSIPPHFSTADQIKSSQDQLASLLTEARDIGIEPSYGDTPLETTRNIRSILEQQVKHFDAQMALLGQLASEAASISSLPAEQTALATSRQIVEQALLMQEGRRIEADGKRAESTSEAAALVNVTETLRTRLTELTEFREKLAIHRDMLKQKTAIEASLKEARSTLLRSSEAAEAANLSYAATQASVLSHEQKLTAEQARHADLADLSKNATILSDGSRARLAGLDQRIRAQRKRDLAFASSESRVMHAISAADEDSKALRSHIERLGRTQSELRQLLSKLQEHVTSGTCPLCGDEHGSESELIARIQSRISTDLLAETEMRLSALQSKLRAHREELDDIRGQRRLLARSIKELEQSRSGIHSALDQLRLSAETVGLNISLPNFLEQLSHLLEQKNTEIVALNEEQGKQHATMRSHSEALEARNGLVAKAEATCAGLEDGLKRARALISRLESNSIFDSLTFNSSDDQILAIQQAFETDLESAARKLPVVEELKTAAAQRAETLRREISQLRSNLNSLRARESANQQRITRFRAQLKPFGMPEDANEEELLAEISKLSSKRATIRQVYEAATNFEMILDAETTAAAHERLRRNTHRRRRELSAIVGQQERYAVWLQYFSSITEFLNNQQTSAIERFTRTYGPRTSVIQQRLRSVYGFDQVEISNEDSEIVVRVHRHGEELRPTDYFSQSQQQTLLLGLFLTACSSQNWSAFMPIFLDDPVTHFDDMNTYALLDLIIGFIEAGGERRQFIVSTCDARLFDLAQQKFAYLEERAKFYRFDAIGADGPIISPRHRSSSLSPLELDE